MHPHIRTLNSAIEGQGLVAERPIRKGEVIWRISETPGVFLTLAEIRRLPAAEQNVSYRQGGRYFLPADGPRYMNHSCDPNAVWLDDETLIAARDIRSGEEVALDYGTTDVHAWWRAKWECRCGAPGCRRFITGRDCLDPAFAQRHREHLPSWTVAFMRRHSGLRGRLSWLLYSGAEIIRRARRGLPRSRAGAGPATSERTPAA